MDSKIELIFDHAYYEMKTYLDDDPMNRAKYGDVYRLKEIDHNNQQYSYMSIEYPFTEAKLYKSEDFDLKNNDVYVFVGETLFDAGAGVSVIFSGLNNALEQRIKYRDAWMQRDDAPDGLSERNEKDRQMMRVFEPSFFESFIEKTKKLNEKPYPPIPIDKEYKFLVMMDSDDDVFQTYLDEYNQKFDTNFKHIEMYETEGYRFSVIQFSIGFIQDLFYLGFHLYYKEHLAREEHWRKVRESEAFKAGLGREKESRDVLKKYKVSFKVQKIGNYQYKSVSSINIALSAYIEDHYTLDDVDDLIATIDTVQNKGASTEVINTTQSLNTSVITSKETKLFEGTDFYGTDNSMDRGFSISTTDFKIIVEAWRDFIEANKIK
jgi:hypothetical protein